MTQTKGQETIIDNLCKRWVLDSLEINGTKKKSAPPENIKNNYTFFNRGGAFQGQNGGMLVEGKWKLDFEKMQITNYEMNNPILKEDIILTIININDTSLSITSSPMSGNKVIMHYKPDKRQNYVVTMGNDTIPGKITLSENAIQLRVGHMLKVDFQNAINNKYYTYRADKIKGFFYENTYYESLVWDEMHYYFERIVKGHLSLYKSSYREPGSGPMMMANGQMVGGSLPQKITEYFITANNSTLIKVKEMNFKKIIMPYLKNCQKLEEKVDGEILKFENLKQVIEEYNSCVK